MAEQPDLVKIKDIIEKAKRSNGLLAPSEVLLLVQVAQAQLTSLQHAINNPPPKHTEVEGYPFAGIRLQ